MVTVVHSRISAKLSSNCNEDNQYFLMKKKYYWQGAKQEGKIVTSKFPVEDRENGKQSRYSNRD